jgi:hypothetical protein
VGQEDVGIAIIMVTGDGGNGGDGSGGDNHGRST